MKINILLLTLLVIASQYVSATRFKQQVIAILQDEEMILKAARFLQTKQGTDTISHYVVKWNPETMTFKQVKWNENKKIYEIIDDPSPIPIGGPNDVMMWADTRIQVIGHGDFSGLSKEVTFGGASPSQIIDRVTALSMGENIGRISVVGCTRNADIAEEQAQMPQDHPGYKLTEKFMTRLKAKKLTKTEVSVRSALVRVDHNGWKLTGRLYTITHRSQEVEIGIEWSHKKSSDKYIGSFEGSEIRIQTEDVKTPVETYNFGILPPDTEVHITPVENAKISYKISDAQAFSWVDQIAGNTYNNIAQGSRADEQIRKVQFLNGRGLVGNQQVKEIRNIQDLLSEMRYYGDIGPTGARPGNEPTSGPITEANHNAVCYRFGDWVLRMNLENFYVRVEGVIVSDTDSQVRKEQVNKLLQNWNNGIPEDYRSMEKGIGNTFFEDVSSWINGEHNNIGLELENAYNAQSGTAIFLSESIRSFQNHFSNMMYLDLAHNGYLKKEFLFSSHPMARGGTWQFRYEGQHPRAGKLMTGTDMLRAVQNKNINEAANRRERNNLKTSQKTIKGISQIAKTWLSHIENDNIIEGSRGPKPEYQTQAYANEAHSAKLSTLNRIGTTAPKSASLLRDYELREATDRLVTSTATVEPETESVNTQIRDFGAIDDASLPLKYSIALANDHAYVSDEIARAVTLKQQQTGKTYEVLPESLEYNENGNAIRFKVQEENNPSSQPEEITASIDKSKLASDELLENLQRQSEEVREPPPRSQPEGRIAKINRGLAIYGVVRGLAGSIEALENGNITQGIVAGAQSLHGLSELRGYNQKLYKAAGKYLGKALQKGVNRASESVATIAGEDAGRLVQARGGEIISTVGEVGEFLEDVPIVGTAFGIYNIYEDFQQHSTIGYIDGALDIAITGLALLGPEVEPVVLALTVIRIGIDSFYNEISKELNSLPSDATVGQKIGAVFKGIGEAVEDLWEEFTLPGQIFGAIDNSHKLDEQYNRDRDFLRRLSNYGNYFSIVKEEGSGAREINFAGGSESWNGGNIEFHLGESSQSTLSLQAVTTNGRQIDETHTINTNGVRDIVLGIGESHAISFMTKSVKFLWFIPVHSKTVISGTSGERETLHGTYYGNSKNNSFIAVQHLPPKSDELDYNLYDYHYQLYGEGGDDSFYLGPQHSYVEGNDGKDTYFIGDLSVYTEINNYADDGNTDYMIINITYNQLTAYRENLDLHISSSNMHMVKLNNWFHGSAYQHMIFKTIDGVFFKVSVTSTNHVELMAYALNGAGALGPLTLDAREHGRLEVVTIIGSNYDDMLYGNSLNNHMNGGAGSDTLKGGNGKDTYTIDFNEGLDTIDNSATDTEVDVLILALELNDIVAFSRQETNHLYLGHAVTNGDRVTDAIIKNWFLGESYRHMILVSGDGIVLDISHTKDPVVSLQPILADMSLEQEQSSGRYSRKLDLSNNTRLSEVVTIIGSSGNDWMIGNYKNNYMTGGTGLDRMEGKEGADVYVVKEGDGKKDIVNFAIDGAIDAILFDANFDSIRLSRSIPNLTLSSGVSLSVVLVDWYSGPAHQHIVVRSVDGVVFDLPTGISDTLEKTARVLDYSNKTTNEQITLEGRWSKVERVLGSQGNDTIIGNSLNNYMDPNIGVSSLRGNNGSDTYMIKSNYGNSNTIYNFAADNHPDILLYPVPFFSIDTEILGNDVRLTSITGMGHVNAMLHNYTASKNFQHLTVISDDGISFVIPEAADFKPVPIIINRAASLTGHHINLTANSSYTEVLTVYGSNQYQNNIIGNDQNNTIVGGSKSDHLEGLDGNDVLKGGGDDDVILGGPGADTIVGGKGNDMIDGGEDDDIIAPGLGANQVNGGPGSDTVIYSGDVDSEDGIHLRLGHGMCIHGKDSVQDTLISVENAYGTEYDDVLEGDEEDNVLVGQGGNDHISPGAGYDVLNGGKGCDTYVLTAANGTVTLENFATDEAIDKVIMTYSTKADFRYEKSGDDLIVRVIHPMYSVFYDPSKPTVIFKGWYLNYIYQHAYIQASDGDVAIQTHADRVANRRSEVPEELSHAAKVTSTYGGGGGHNFDDVKNNVRIIGIHSMIIRAGNQVDSIQVTYRLVDGSTWQAPRRGGGGGSENRIHFAADEHIYKVEGKTNNYIVDQLTFHIIDGNGTTRINGPYGRTGQQVFSYEGHVVSFHGGAGSLMDRIGFYNLEHLSRTVIRTRHTGGPGGGAFDDIQSRPDIVGIRSLTIRSGNQVDSIQVTYALANGLTYIAPRHGGTGGFSRSFSLASGEFISKVEGKTNGQLVDQLTFTITRPDGSEIRRGPYGRTGQTPFAVDGHVIAFYGGSGSLMDRIGFYQLNKLRKSVQFGGQGGIPFNDHPDSSSPLSMKITRLVIHAGNQVDSIQAEYLKHNGEIVLGARYGGLGGLRYVVDVRSDEVIIKIEGKTNGVLIDQLTFYLKNFDGTIRKQGPFGITGRTPFALTANNGIYGFFGRAGSLVDGLGVYYS